MKKDYSIVCPGKINLSLDVINRRDDGYHNLQMIMQEIKLYDTLDISIDTDTDETKIILTSEDNEMPTDERNLVYKAAKSFFTKTGIHATTRIHVSKCIPMGAGLGGGSSDAAGTLKALNSIFENPLSISELAVMAKSLGADVPFFIYGGCMLAEGIGEILTPLPQLSGVVTVVAKPPIHISTAYVYANLVLNRQTVHPDTNAAVQALKNNNPDLLAKACGNVLETVTAKEYPEIEEYKSTMLNCGAIYSLMSGSGSSVFGIFRDEKSAYTALEKFKVMTPFAYIV